MIPPPAGTRHSAGWNIVRTVKNNLSPSYVPARQVAGHRQVVG